MRQQQCRAAGRVCVRGSKNLSVARSQITRTAGRVRIDANPARRRNRGSNDLVQHERALSAGIQRQSSGSRVRAAGRRCRDREFFRLGIRVDDRDAQVIARLDFENRQQTLQGKNHEMCGCHVFLKTKIDLSLDSAIPRRVTAEPKVSNRPIRPAE
jgi:hypothetical protein